MVPTAVQKAVAKSTETQGATVEMSIDKSCTLSGGLDVLVSFHNSGDEPFYCQDIGGLPNADMQLKLVNQATEKPVEMTSHGKNLQKNLKHLSQAGLGKVDKGETKAWTVPLKDFYSLTPGHYRLSASFVLVRHFYSGEKFKISVDKLDFAVTR